MTAVEARFHRVRRHGSDRTPASDRPAAVDLGGWIRGPVTDQGLVPLCTAAVVTTLARYWAARDANLDFVPSVLFNYRLSRRLADRPDRQGSTLRHSLAAWRLFGLVAEDRWPYRPDRVDADPPAALLAAARWRDVAYGRLDGPDLSGPEYLDEVRGHLALGIPLSVEFPLGPSLVSSFRSGLVALPGIEERCVGRHVVAVVGYDDELPTGRATGAETYGALRFRNNWGSGWGDDGHGWLPYEFLLHSISRQTWLVIHSPWRAADVRVDA